MPLHAGDRLGPYEVVGAIGAGGMGEVYRGHDTRLDRAVAIKVLPDAVANDPDRLARFEREARTLAALNHPNVAQIYGLEGSALAMEFVEGEDLSSRIARGPVPLDEALEIATQIAEALEAAHEFGIIHRDLKPSNIRVRADGVVKVLDFGLAKALAPPASRLEVASSPTITSPALTERGVIIGTAAYMAPEQARGRTADKRADIWAFGVVLYEMVTSRRPFEGETVSESLAGVLKSEPEWTPVPAELRRLLRSCLEKDPKKRLRDIGDWRRQLDDPGAAEPTSTRDRSRLAWIATAVVTLAAAVLAVVHFGETDAVVPAVVFEIPPPPGNTFETGMSVSPDGGRVAFTASGPDGVVRVWIRDLAALEARSMAGTEGARNVNWSPDGRHLAFASGRTLRRIPVEGGPVLTIAESGSIESMGGSSWSPHGVIVFGGTRAGVIRRVPESGGPVEPLTAIGGSPMGIAHGIPAFLPDGRHFLYTRVSTDETVSGVYVGSVDLGPDEQENTRLLGAPRAVYTEDDRGGHLLYLREGTLVSQPFDTERLQLTGEPGPIAEGVGNYGAFGFFAAGGRVVAYRSGIPTSGTRASQLTWVDRQGQKTGTVGGPAAYDGVAISPDGRRAAVVQVGPSATGLGNIDIWIVDLSRSVSQRLTSDRAADRFPVWSASNGAIAFQSSRSGVFDLLAAPSDGTGAAELMTTSERSATPTSWSSDGRFILFDRSGEGTSGDVWLLPMQGDRTPIALVQTRFFEAEARFSPDMRWIAYTSDVSGQAEVYVRPFDPAAPESPVAATLLSRAGGRSPRWRNDGGELFYQALSGPVMSVGVETDGPLRPGEPRALFTPPDGAAWDVTSDGTRFLVAMPPAEVGLAPITVLFNWKARAQ